MTHHTIKLQPGDTLTIIVPSPAHHIPPRHTSIYHWHMLGSYPIVKAIQKAGLATPDQLTGNTRKHHIVFLRCIIAHHLVTQYKLSRNQVGRLLNRDHATIIHYLRQHKTLLEHHPPYQKTINIIKAHENHQNQTNL